MKIKWTMIVIVGYLLFSAFMYYYLFVMSTGDLPDIYKGTSADPSTFLNEQERSLSGEFSKIKNLLFFLSTPLEWLIYFFIVLFGLSHRFEKWVQEAVRITFLRTSIYLFYLSVFTFIVTFPLQYISFHLSKAYNISAQTFSQWMKDELIDFWIGYGLMMILIFVMYELMKRFKKRWWLAAWMLFVPFTIFLMYVQPVFIDPLYNEFYPLKDKQLEAKILSLADQADIPANHVYEVNMSEKTHALNAYVTGIGSNARIVLWDTTLNKLNEEEILFVMAHEMAHYVKKHIYIGIASYLVLAFIGFWFIAKMMEWLISRQGEKLNITDIAQLRTLPLIFMMISMLSFVASPFSNAISRFEEKQSDAYAIEMTGNKAAAISAFQKLAKEGLSEVKPPLLVKIFRYGHPSMAERIYTIETYPLKETKEKKGNN